MGHIQPTGQKLSTTGLGKQFKATRSVVHMTTGICYEPFLTKYGGGQGVVTCSNIVRRTYIFTAILSYSTLLYDTTSIHFAATL